MVKKNKTMRLLLETLLLYLVILGTFTLGTMLILNNQNPKEQYWWQRSNKEVRYE